MTLSGNVVTVNPDVDLTASTVYVLTAIDGAVTQSVDANGVADAAGVRRPPAGGIGWAAASQRARREEKEAKWAEPPDES